MDIIRLTGSLGRDIELLELVIKALNNGDGIKVIKGPDLTNYTENDSKYKRVYFDICKTKK